MNNTHKEESIMYVDRVRVRKHAKAEIYYIHLEIGNTTHSYVMTKKLAESLIKNLNRL